MITFLALLAGLYSVGAVILFVGMYFAPESYEDETGFNIVWSNDRPEAANIACVWSFAEAKS
jgi:hypothetical protein